MKTDALVGHGPRRSRWICCCLAAVPISQGFSCRGTQLEGVWSAIPEGVDILLTHMPPFNRLDLAFDRGTHAKVDPCPVCGETHRRYVWTIGWRRFDYLLAVSGGSVLYTATSGKSRKYVLYLDVHPFF